MSPILTIIVIVGLVAAVFLILRQRQSAAHPANDRPLAPSGTLSDPVKAREEARVAHMSPEDRAWEAASLQRNRDNQARADARVQ